MSDEFHLSYPFLFSLPVFCNPYGFLGMFSSHYRTQMFSFLIVCINHTLNYSRFFHSSETNFVTSPLCLSQSVSLSEAGYRVCGYAHRLLRHLYSYLMQRHFGTSLQCHYKCFTPCARPPGPEKSSATCNSFPLTTDH